jgi:hypothetical protein
MNSRTLLDLLSTLDDLSNQSTLKRILWRGAVAGHIQVAYRELEGAVGLFNVSTE